MTQFQKPEQSGQAAALPKTYGQHPLSAAFPAMTPEEFQKLKDSIENFGPMSPVVIANGMVLHGWDIYRACTELAVPYQVQELPGHVTPQDYLDAQSIGRKATSVEQVSGPNAIVLALESIRIDGNTQSRVELDQAVVAEYAEAMAEGAQFPPLIVFFDGVHRWLGDGFHRLGPHAQPICRECAVYRIFALESCSREYFTLHFLGHPYFSEQGVQPVQPVNDRQSDQRAGIRQDDASH